jgi:hypothetical protein
VVTLRELKSSGSIAVEKTAHTRKKKGADEIIIIPVRKGK